MAKFTCQKARKRTRIQGIYYTNHQQTPKIRVKLSTIIYDDNSTK